MLEGKNQSLLLVQTAASAALQSKKRMAGASPNQKVPAVVEFAFCPHQNSVVNALLQFISSAQREIVSINVEFSVFELVKSQNPLGITKKVVIFNQPAHPEALRQRILPIVVKNSVS